jgi:hypothetical protein
MGGTCRTHEGMKNVDTIFVENPEAKRPLWRANRKREDNIKLELAETGVIV